jgi:tetratricopeptide (TPR) repeat protein
MTRKLRIALWSTAAVLLVVLGWRAQRPLDAALLLQRGEARLAARDAETALRDFQRVASIPSERGTALNGVARALEARGDMAGALATHESLIAVARAEDWPLDGMATELRNVGLLGYRTDKLDRAAAAFEELHALGGSWLEPDMLRSLTALRRGDATEAGRMQPELRVRYGDIEPLWRLAMATEAIRSGARPTVAALEALTNLRATPSDVAAAQKLLGADADRDPIAIAVVGEAALNSNDLQTARTAFDRLVGGPLDALARIGLGRIAMQNGDAEAALGQFDVAAADARVPRELLEYWRGQALQSLGRLDAARTTLAAAVAANPLGLRAEASLGAVDAARGDATAAEADFARVLAVDPKHPETLFRLGKMLAQGPRRAAGLQLLQRYLAAYPSGRYAAEARQLAANGS